MTKPSPIVARGIEKVGSQAALGALLGVDQQLISYWLKKAKGGVPAERVADFARVTGIPREEIRPDIYPPNEKQRARVSA